MFIESVAGGRRGGVSSVGLALDKIREESGLDGSAFCGISLEECFERFSKAKGYASAEECAADILSDAHLLEDFHRGLLVPETWFFRYAKQYEVLREIFLRFDFSFCGKFAVLCAPCSTGEEAYSAAAVLLDCGAGKGDFSVDGADICPDFLAAAERGRYQASSLKDKLTSDMGTYFDISASGDISVRGELKNSVSFFRANLISGNSHFANAPYNVVFCRNLAIYFSSTARRRLFDTILNILSEGGIVFSGDAEDFSLMDNRFEPVGKCGCFAYARRVEADSINEKLGIAARKGILKVGYSGLLKISGKGKERISCRLNRARSLANRGHLDEAMHLCLADIEYMPTSKNLFLAGDISLALSKFARAVEYFKRSAALDTGDGEVLFKLHLAYMRLGNKEKADLYLEKFRMRNNLQQTETL